MLELVDDELKDFYFLPAPGTAISFFFLTLVSASDDPLVSGALISNLTPAFFFLELPDEEELELFFFLPRPETAISGFLISIFMPAPPLISGLLYQL